MRQTLRKVSLMTAILTVTQLPLPAESKAPSSGIPMTAKLFEPFATFMFEIVGTVVTVDSSGKRSPLAGVRFYSGDVKDGRTVGELVKGCVTDKTGVFRELASAMVPLEKVCTDLGARTAHFVLRAKGCDDLMLEATPDWKPHEVEMQCSGRTR